jgi:hypothetical protein
LFTFHGRPYLLGTRRPPPPIEPGLVVDGSNFRKILWSSTYASALRQHRSIEHCRRDIGTERTRTDETASPQPVFSSRDSHR